MSSGSCAAHTAAAAAPAAAPPSKRLSGTCASVTAGPRPGTHNMAASDLARYHERTRRKGVNNAIFWTLRVVLGVAMQVYFSFERTGRKNIPKKGPVILASTHRSFLDPFLIGCLIRRPVYFVAKRELFDRRWQGWILNRLGAFPIRRGEADEDSMATARGILERGRGLGVLPEGTRHPKGGPGPPKRGAGKPPPRTR